MSKKKERKPKAPWPAQQAIEFAIGLSALMKRRDDMTRAELARVTGTARSRISNVLSAAQNLELSSMQELASAIGGTVHIVVTDKGELGRWTPDVLSPSEKAPNLKLGWPRSQVLRFAPRRKKFLDAKDTAAMSGSETGGSALVQGSSNA